MLTRLSTLLVAAAVVTLLAGCGASSPESDPYLTAAPGASGPGTAPGEGVFPLVPATHPHVQRQCPLLSAVHYDPGAIAPGDVEGVFICTTAPYTDAPDGTPQIVEFVDRVASADVSGLLEVYSAPDADRTDDPCAAMLRDPLIVWLHYGDEQITPVYAPMDECGFPADDAAAVYDGLDLHRLLVAREKLTT